MSIHQANKLPFALFHSTVLKRTVRPLLANAMLLGSIFMAAPAAHADTVLLNVSYDVTRELFKEINPAFIAEWKKLQAKPLPSTNHTAAPANRRVR